MKQSLFFVAVVATQFLYTTPDEYRKPRTQLTTYEQSARDTVRHQSNSLWSERTSFYPAHDLNTRLYDSWSMHDVTPIVHAAIKRHSDNAVAKRQEKAAKEQQRQAERSRERQQWLAAKQQAIHAREHIRHTFEAQRTALSNASKEWTQIQDIYQEYGLRDDGRYARRKQALANSHAYEFKSYSLTPAATQLIRDIRTDAAEYQMCYGNQLQQVIHQECIDGIGRLAGLPETSVVYSYKDSMTLCFDAARAYNQAGAADKATAIADFCWTLLDYGKAIAEGAVAGVVSAVEDLIEHPGQALLCVVAGKYVLAYQLGKILCNVADIGLTYAFDAERGKKKWDEYVAPATQLIAAISNKEISVRDGLKGATQFAMQLKAQDKLLRGMNRFCTTAKDRALEFAKNNPLVMPEQYMVTPEGYTLELLKERMDPELQFTECLREKLARSKNPAHGATQYQHLRKDLFEEQYTAIVKCSKHGLQRLMERFTPEEVAALIGSPDTIKQQQDGARALIKKSGERYSIIVLNPQNEVITGIHDIDQKAMTKLGKNYGWDEYGK